MGNSVQPIDVLWLVEHVARELDVACAVKALLEKERAVHVEIVPIQANMKTIARRFQPRVVVFPFFYNAEKLERVLTHWRSALYFNLAWEQLLYGANQKYKTLVGDFARYKVIHHAWGDFFRNILVGQGVPAEHILVNGQPAYKLYDHPYRGYYPSRSELAAKLNLDSTRRWVLFPENYNWAFYPRYRIRELVAQGADGAELEALRDFCEVSLREVFRWCKEAAENFAVEIIIRPRPSTSSAMMKARVRQVLGALPAHLHVIKEGSVREWILAADVVVSSYSTSLIEAAVAGKGAYMLEPIPIPAALQTEWQGYAPRIKTYAEFAERCQNDADETTAQPLQTWARGGLLANGDPIAAIADYLRMFLQPDFGAPPRPAAELFSAIHAESSIHRLKRSVREILKVVYRRGLIKILIFFFPARIHRPYEMDDFTPKEVEKRTRRWRETLNQ